MASKMSGSSNTDKSTILSRLEDKDGLKLHNNSLDDYGMSPVCSYVGQVILE